MYYVTQQIVQQLKTGRYFFASRLLLYLGTNNYMK